MEEILCDYFLKNKVLFIYNSSSSSSSSSITYILLNNSNIFWHNVFKLNWTFILKGCREYLYISVCSLYSMTPLTPVLLKWNGKKLMEWLSEQFWRCCLCIYALI